MATPRSIRPEERHNREEIDNQEREDTRDNAEEYVEADQPESEEDRLVRQGVTDIEHGQREKVIVHDIRNTSRTLDLMGRHDDAQKLLEDAEALDGIADSDLGQGEREVERAAEIHRQVEVEDLAVQVVEGHQNLAVWQGAINNITRIAEHHISADQYAHAAGGSAKGKQLRSEILSMGDWLNRNLSQPIEDVKQAAHIVGRIFELVAAVLTVYDHVPEPVKQALGRALTTLGPFAAYLGFVH